MPEEALRNQIIQQARNCANYTTDGYTKVICDVIHEYKPEVMLIGATNIGRVYNSSGTIFFYNRLLLERFLYDLPADASARYSSQIFNRQTAKLFNDEMLHTIETFFENSLNLSETARKLYIHRNTLVYRLEKVQRAIGLDLRSFDDAVTFKMMMLLGKNTQPRKNRL